MRRAAKVDQNQDAIVSALRAAGASVQSMAQLGKGVPDLLIGHEGETWVMEVKNGPSAKLTEDQVEWLKNWKGAVHIVREPDDALRIIGAL